MRVSRTGEAFGQGLVVRVMTPILQSSRGSEELGGIKEPSSIPRDKQVPLTVIDVSLLRIRILKVQEKD